jgi:3-hydroxybutyryl-CoA dehydrogenase
MQAKDVQAVAVLGAGQMGAGIAQVFATAGMTVRLFDVNEGMLQRGMRGIEKNLQKLQEKGRLAESAADVFARVKAINSLDQIDGVEVVIEAVVENEAAKLELFRGVHKAVGSNVIFASNTSSLSITRMGALVGRPEKFVGMHFMNPAPVMKLVEVVVGLATAPETVTFIEQLADRLGKTHVRAADHPGFIVNRILLPMINEAVCALGDQVGSPEDIDTAMLQGTNQPMGPLALADLIGLDTVLAIMCVMHTTFGDDKYRPAPLLRRYVDAGYLGRKVGRGFYVYTDK